MPALQHADFCDRLAPLVHRMADVLEGADLSAPVPTCGDDWTLYSLAEHLGLIHRWAERLVRDLSPERIDRAALGVTVPDAAGMAAWMRAGAAPLVAAFRATNPDAPMWAWGADQHARFWSRRQVHETAVHLHDAELAAGVAVSPIEPAVADDGVDEFLVNMPCAARWAPRIAELRGHGEEIALHATDTGSEWTLTLTSEGLTWSRAVSAAPVVRAAATAETLYLLLWQRRGLEHCAVEGSPGALATVLAAVEDF